MNHCHRNNVFESLEALESKISDDVVLKELVRCGYLVGNPENDRTLGFKYWILLIAQGLETREIETWTNYQIKD